ncbi:MAG: TfoX/Sxy family protein [Flavobacteriales bacterium]|nr:TfoX/Sxy family protein [Flavobacteriales bacterium]
MGNKGDKMTSDSVSTAEKIVQKLQKLGDISSKKMFGGHGIFIDKSMFGMIDSKGVVFFKVDEKLKLELNEYGSKPHSKMPYSSIPNEVLDSENLIEWAEKSINLIKNK